MTNFEQWYAEYFEQACKDSGDPAVPLIDWHSSDSRESAMAAKWAEAEDKIRVLEDHLQFVERWANHHASKPLPHWRGPND